MMTVCYIMHKLRQKLRGVPGPRDAALRQRAGCCQARGLGK